MNDTLQSIDNIINDVYIDYDEYLYNTDKDINLGKMETISQELVNKNANNIPSIRTWKSLKDNKEFSKGEEMTDEDYALIKNRSKKATFYTGYGYVPARIEVLKHRNADGFKEVADLMEYTLTKEDKQ